MSFNPRFAEPQTAAEAKQADLNATAGKLINQAGDEAGLTMPMAKQLIQVARDAAAIGQVKSPKPGVAAESHGPHFHV